MCVSEGVRKKKSVSQERLAITVNLCNLCIISQSGKGVQVDIQSVCCLGDSTASFYRTSSDGMNVEQMCTVEYLIMQYITQI